MSVPMRRGDSSGGLHGCRVFKKVTPSCSPTKILGYFAICRQCTYARIYAILVTFSWSLLLVTLTKVIRVVRVLLAFFDSQGDLQEGLAIDAGELQGACCGLVLVQIGQGGLTPTQELVLGEPVFVVHFEIERLAPVLQGQNKGLIPHWVQCLVDNLLSRHEWPFHGNESYLRLGVSFSAARFDDDVRICFAYTNMNNKEYLVRTIAVCWHQICCFNESQMHLCHGEESSLGPMQSQMSFQ